MAKSQKVSLIAVSRPRFWLYVLGPYALGVIAAVPDVRRLLDLEILVWGLFFLFPANLLIYGINDVFDYETDRRNAKKEGYEALVRPETHRVLLMWIAATCLPFLPRLPAAGGPATLALLGFLFFSVEYSAPPIRAKARPFLDAAFNVLYVFPAIFGYYLAGGDALQWQAVAAGWCWCFAMHAFSAVPDISADREAGLATVATVLGARGTEALCAVLYLAAGLLAMRYVGPLAPALAVGYALVMAWSYAGATEKAAFSVYRFFPLGNILSGMLLTLTLLAQRV